MRKSFSYGRTAIAFQAASTDAGPPFGVTIDEESGTETWLAEVAQRHA